MMFHRISRTRVLAALPILTVFACHGDARYASFGVEALDAETAPWVLASTARLDTFMENLSRDLQQDVTSAIIAGSPASCGSSTYDGNPGEFAAGATVTLALTDCQSGAATDSVTVTLHNSLSGDAPTPTAFAAHVSYQGTFDGELTVQGDFELDFYSEGGSGPLAGDHDFASWTLDNVDETAPLIVGRAEDKYVELTGLSRFFSESPTAVEPQETRSTAFVLTEPVSLATLTVSTETNIVGAPSGLPSTGVVRFVDADGAEVSFDMQAMTGPSDTSVRMTVDVDTSDGVVDFDGDVSVASVSFPEGAANAASHPGWL